MKTLIVACALFFSQLASADAVTVLMYHRVVSEFTADTPPGETAITVNQFKEQMNWLHLQGYKTVLTRDLTKMMSGNKPLPSKTVVLSFDDGWIDQLNTLPIMKQYKYRGVFAIIARIPDTKYPVYMTWDQVRLVAKDHEIASHMYSHSHLNDGSMDYPAAAEIIASKEIIEKQVKKPITTIVWPYGEYNKTFIATAKNIGFNAAMTVNQSWCIVPDAPKDIPWETCLTMTKNDAGQDPLYIRRTVVDGRCDLAFFIKSVETGAADTNECVK